MKKLKIFESVAKFDIAKFASDKDKADKDKAIGQITDNIKKSKLWNDESVNESLTLNNFKIGEKVNYNGSDMYIRTLDMEKGVGLSEDETGLITVGVIPERFLELVKKLDTY